jgi:hypothetical protein
MYLGLRPWHILCVIFLVTLIINYPYMYLVYVPQSAPLAENDPARVYLQATSAVKPTYHFIQFTPWALSSLGRGVLNTMFFIKHGLTLLIDLITSVVWFALFRHYYSHKSNLVQSSIMMHAKSQEAKAVAILVSSPEVTSSGQNQLKSQQPDQEEQQNQQQQEIELLKKRSGPRASTASHHNRRLRSLAAERRMCHMVLLNSVLCVLHHVVLAASTGYYLNYSAERTTANVEAMTYAAHYASLLRHTLCFVMFFAFNSAFRNEFKCLCRLGKRPTVEASHVAGESRINEETVARRQSRQSLRRHSRLSLRKQSRRLDMLDDF